MVPRGLRNSGKRLKTMVCNISSELVSENLHKSFLDCHDLVNKKKSCIRIGKREFACEFSKLFCPGQ